MISNLIKRILSSILLVPLSFFFIIKGDYFFNFFLIILLIISLFEWLKMKNIMIVKFTGIIMIVVSFYSVFQIRYFNNGENILDFLIIVIVCIATDLGGYSFGKILKGPKLISISPNKTIAGFFGGFICSVLAMFILSHSTFLKSYNLIIDFNLSFLFYIISISLISQIGDLIISYYKRKSNLKDTGNIIPGHGGILDRIDGMIFVFPIVYVFKYLF